MKNRNKIVYYQSGDYLSFTLKNERDKISDRISTFLDDSLIVFEHNNINVNRIDGVYVDKKIRTGGS